MDRLRVFVCDGLAVGTQVRPTQALARRNELLSRALLADLDALTGVEVTTMAGPGSTSDKAMEAARSVADSAAVYTARQAPVASPPPRWRPGDPYLDACIGAADAVWPLALEAGGMLERLSREILRAGRVLLGSSPGALDIAGSKLKLAQALSAGGVAAAAVYSPHTALPQAGGPWVAKPDDGAGCVYSRLFSDRAGALAWTQARPADGYVLQPFIPGRPGSLSLICCDGMTRVLACNMERVAMRDNRFHVLGSVVNGLADDDGALTRLAQQVTAAIPGLWGYVGIDFVMTARGAVVLDVNPRLTAAYVGLHASIGRNPAGLVLDLLKRPAIFPAPVPPARRRAVSVDLGAA